MRYECIQVQRTEMLSKYDTLTAVKKEIDINLVADFLKVIIKTADFIVLVINELGLISIALGTQSKTLSCIWPLWQTTMLFSSQYIVLIWIYFIYLLIIYLHIECKFPKVLLTDTSHKWAQNWYSFNTYWINEWFAS